MSTRLPSLPIVDIRDGGPLHHARDNAPKARALRDACLGFFPRAVLPLVPTLDNLSRRWMSRSRSPYVEEIAEIASALGFSGIWLLNASFQWGCTSLACEQDGAPWLARTLDWPFHGLGHHTELARMRGEKGDFFSVTWPGYVGVLTAMAPLRFAAVDQPGADAPPHPPPVAAAVRFCGERADGLVSRRRHAAGSTPAPRLRDMWQL